MNFYDANLLADDDKVTISGRDLKLVMLRAQLLDAGYVPKSAELIDIWAGSLETVVKNATLVINTGIPNV